MKLLLTIKEQDIFPEAPVMDAAGFRRREAARAVVLDDSGSVPLLKVNRYQYHKLPGGGVDKDEDIETALERELMEEIGCKVEVTAEVGEIVEYRDQLELIQTSHCFLAKQIGEKQAPAFTEKETAHGFEIVWAKDIDEAVRLLTHDKPTDYEGKFIRRRDLAFLKTARESFDL